MRININRQKFLSKISNFQKVPEKCQHVDCHICPTKLYIFPISSFYFLFRTLWDFFILLSCYPWWGHGGHVQNVGSFFFEEVLGMWHQGFWARPQQVLRLWRIEHDYQRLFAETFDLSSTGPTACSELPDETTTKWRLDFSLFGFPLSFICLKKDLNVEFRLLADLVSKYQLAKVCAFDKVTRKSSLSWVNVNWSDILFNMKEIQT